MMNHEGSTYSCRSTDVTKLLQNSEETVTAMA